MLIYLSSLKIVSYVAILNEPFTSANTLMQSLSLGRMREIVLGTVGDDLSFRKNKFIDNPYSFNCNNLVLI